MEATYVHVVVDQDGAAILDLERGRISMLNPMGVHVCQGIQRGDTIEKVISTLAHETGEDIHIIERDVRAFLGVLREQGLIRY